MKNLRYRFDSSVLLFIIFVMLVAGSSFAYRYYTVPVCPELSLEVSEETIEVGEMVMFTSRNFQGEYAEWDFGDNSPLVKEHNATHSFEEPGEYVIKLTVNGGCSEVKRIVVKPGKPLMNEALLPKFAFPKSVEINQRVRFKCLTENAESYEWRFGETGKVDSRDRNPRYSFSSPGLKTVSLIINGNDRYIAKHMVHVMPPKVPKPPKKPEAAPKEVKANVPHVPDSPEDYASFDMMKEKEEAKKTEKEKVLRLSNDELGSTIIDFAQGKASLRSFTPSFCDRTGKLLIEANGKLMKFPDFLETVKGENIRIKEIRTIRGEAGCIQQVILRYKK